MFHTACMLLVFYMVEHLLRCLLILVVSDYVPKIYPYDERIKFDFFDAVCMRWGRAWSQPLDDPAEFFFF